MKVSRSLPLVLASAILYVSCAAPKETEKKEPVQKKAQAQGAATDAVASEDAEHCLKAGETSYCFLEVYSEETVDFYATGESYEKLLLDPLVAEIEIQVKPLDQASYEKKKKAIVTKLEYEGAQSNGVNIFTDKMNENALYTDVMFRVISFLWKAAKNYNEEEPSGILDKIKSKFSYYKDKLGNKLSSIFSRGSVDSSANSAGGLKARVTWHYGTAVVTKPLMVPIEYTAEASAEAEQTEKQ